MSAVGAGRRTPDSFCWLLSLCDMRGRVKSEKGSLRGLDVGFMPLPSECDRELRGSFPLLFLKRGGVQSLSPATSGSPAPAPDDPMKGTG